MSQVYIWEMAPEFMLELTLWEPLWILRSPSRCIWGPHFGGFYEGSGTNSRSLECHAGGLSGCL